MTANGSLVLINPNGIVFSKGSQVDVHSLIATPSDISNANFMAGRMKFDKPPSNPAATVVNKGTITVAQRGLAALVAPGVENAGLIEAKLAKVTVAGAETFAIDLYGDGLISFDVSSLVTTTPIGPGGKPLAALVSNSGRINAPGGTVLLTADAVAGIVENIVDVPGTIMARTVGDVPGSVMIDAGPTGTANLAGKISVSGLRQGQVGGSATITGNAVNLASTARIKARGDAAGGIVRIGGGPHGQDPILRNAQRTSVATGAVIDASATGVGDGGQVTVWSDQGTEFGGTIKARGGPRGGNGGRIETSGKLDLSVLPSAQVDAAAPMGKAGNWLLDPGNLTVANSNSNITPANGSGATVTPGPPVPDNATVDAAVVSGTLNGGTNVTLSTVGAPGTLNGDITVNAISSPPTLSSISWSTAAQLTLNAAGNISILSRISGTNGALALLAGGTISQTAAGTITVANLDVRTQNDAGSAITLTNPANAVSGDVTLSALNGAGTAPAPGPISFVDSTGFTVAAQPGNGLNGQEIGINTSGTISLQGGSTIQINGAVGNPAAGSVSVTADTNDILVNGAITSGNSVFLNATGGAITQTAGIITAGSLGVNAAGSVSLPGPNAVGTLTGSVSSPSGKFLFRDDRQDLVIGFGDGTGVFTNGGPLTVGTTGTSATGFNLSIEGGSVVSSSGGPITLRAGGHGGTFTNNGIVDSTAGSPPATPGVAGNILILADSMMLGTGTIGAATLGAAGTVVLGPATLTNSIALGTPAQGGSLNLLQSDLDSISAGMLQVGYRNVDGTPSLTGNINILSGITINTTQVPNLLLVTSGSVFENFGATISALPSTSPPSTPPPLSLGVVAGGPVALSGANRVATLAGYVDGVAKDFVYRNDGAPLTTGTLPAPTIGVAFDATGIPSSANMTGPASNPLSGITTNGGALTVATTGGPGGVVNLTVGPSVSVASGGGAITLMAGGAGGTFVNDGSIDSTTTSLTAAGNIAIVADAVTLAPGIINAATTGASGTVVVGPFTAADGISLGMTGSPGIMGLPPADLASISAGVLQVGYRNVDGTPSLTGNIDIVAPITVDTTKLAGLLLVTGGSVTEAPGAFINSMAGGPPLALGIVAGGPVSLGEANQVGDLAGLVDGTPSNSFLYRNDGAGLTVGTLSSSDGRRGFRLHDWNRLLRQHGRTGDEPAVRRDSRGRRHCAENDHRGRIDPRP